MKLFTKEIDKKLFSQFEQGSDLENQMVIAKIYNPTGLGNWYIINSDPSDSDYLWAIVDLMDVEMGSVSRSELESIKVPPFRLPLERDMYFEPINALELYRGLMAGKKYAEGGEINIEAENKDMLLNYAEELEHHVEEFEEAAKKAQKVMPWVIAKIERASTDLSDVTHYLLSENEKRREYENGEGEEEKDIDDFDRGGVVSVKVGDRVKSKSGVDGEVYESTGSMFKIQDKYGNKNSKWYSTRDFKKSEIKLMEEGGMMDKGGRLMGVGDTVIYDNETHFITEKNGVVGIVNMKQGAWGSNFPFIPISKINVSEEVTDMYGEKVKILDNRKFSGGGMSDFGDFYEWSIKEVNNKFNSQFDDGFPIVKFVKDSGNKIVESAFGVLKNGKNVVFDVEKVEWNIDNKMADGGMMAKGSEVSKINENSHEDFIVKEEDIKSGLKVINKISGSTGKLLKIDKNTKRGYFYTGLTRPRKLGYNRVTFDEIKKNYYKLFTKDGKIMGVDYDKKKWKFNESNNSKNKQMASGGMMADGGKLWKRGSTVSFKNKSEANKRLKLMKDDGSYKNLKVEETTNGWVVKFDFKESGSSLISSKTALDRDLGENLWKFSEEILFKVLS
jgi:hypothetical protein